MSPLFCLVHFWYLVNGTEAKMMLMLMTHGSFLESSWMTESLAPLVAWKPPCPLGSLTGKYNLSSKNFLCKVLQWLRTKPKIYEQLLNFSNHSIFPGFSEQSRVGSDLQGVNPTGRCSLSLQLWTQRVCGFIFPTVLQEKWIKALLQLRKHLTRVRRNMQEQRRTPLSQALKQKFL